MGVVLAAYVGIGRLYLGVHWPTDVLAGWALGLAQSAMAVWWLARIRCAPSSFSKGGPMRSTRTLGAAVAAGLLAACAEASIPAPPTGYGFAYATRDCGPADGPAVRLFLVPQEVTLWPPSGARVEVAVWRATTQLPGADLVWSGATNLGWAGRCDDVAQCEAATDARVTFRGFAADSTLTGSVDLGFGDGSRVTGGFNAVWHPATPICG